jgi:hypothetical protein
MENRRETLKHGKMEKNGHGNRKTEDQVIFLAPFTVCLSCRRNLSFVLLLTKKRTEVICFQTDKRTCPSLKSQFPISFLFSHLLAKYIYQKLQVAELLLRSAGSGLLKSTFFLWCHDVCPFTFSPSDNLTHTVGHSDSQTSEHLVPVTVGPSQNPKVDRQFIHP